MSVRRSLIVLFLVSVLLPLIAFGMQANTQITSQASAQNVQLYTVRPGNLDVAITAVGSVEAEAVVSLSFTSGGRITEVLVQAGDYVLAGDVLARQANDSQRIAYDQAVLALQTAQIRLDDVLQPVSEDDIRIAEANVNSAWGGYLSIQNSASEEDIRAAELRLEAARQAEADANTERRSASTGFPRSYYDTLEARIGEASFNAEIARLQLESLRNGNQDQLNVAYARAVQAERELDRVLAGPTQAEIDTAQIGVQQAQAALAQAENALNRGTLTAPFDGVISSVLVEQGALAVPGSPAVEITDISPLHIAVQIDEIDLRQIREAMPARVRLDALPGLDLPAVIETIGLVGQDEEGIVSYDVRLGLEQTDPQVLVGMTAEAVMIVEERRDVLLVPNLYIRLDRQRDRAFVNVVDADGALRETEVTLGLRGQESSEIITGLSDGNIIAIDLSTERFLDFGA